MEVILKQDIDNLGYKHDIVNIKDGYGCNYLIPQGYAELATTGAKKMLAENLKQHQHKEIKEIEDARKLAHVLKDVNIKIVARVGIRNKLYGSVNNINLAEELSRKGYHIDRKYINIPGGIIKTTGPYTAQIRLHREVIIDFSFDVVKSYNVQQVKSQKSGY